MKPVLIYVLPIPTFGGHLFGLAQRFVGTYAANKPQLDHELRVVSNGGPPTKEAKDLFDNLDKFGGFLEHDNSGQDIGAYQLAAKTIDCELMVFFGVSSYIRGPGWLERMASVYQVYGDGLFGCTGNQGDSRMTAWGAQRVWPHVRTTGFWCSPKLINEHPFKIKDNAHRYAWEHGPIGLTSWALRKKKPVMIVGWNDIKPLMQCDSMVGGFHKGNQENLLIGDRLTSPPYYHCA